MQFGIGRAQPLCLVLAGLLAACGKDPGGAAAPHPVSDEPAEPSTPGESGSATQTGDEDPGEPRLQLDAEFHRTRFGLGTGIWVLGVVHNPHQERVTDVRLRVRMLDEAEQLAGQADDRLGRSLGPGERAAAAVLVPEPVAHDHLQLAATAIPDVGPPPEPLALRLEHEPPARADIGGWYVVGKVENSGAAAIEGARVEVQGLDKAGKLLGIDWLILDRVEPGETMEFDVGDLRYEEPPTKFIVELRGPLPDP